MSTLRQIVDYANRKFPNTETDANKVADLNDIQNELYVELRKLSNQYDIYSDTTIADQYSYALPTDCEFENIIKIEVGITSDNDDYEEYKKASLNKDIECGNYFTQGTAGLYFLFQNELPINESGRDIKIYYFPKPTQLSSADMTVSPELDPLYHTYLKYRLIGEIASQGDNPSTAIADFWLRRAEEMKINIIKSLSDKANYTNDLECTERM